nr:RICIN domain-containing protein [uncultured Chitinophaga sp.]
MKKTHQLKLILAATIVTISLGGISCKKEIPLQSIQLKTTGAFARAASGATYYVDPDGNDNNSGTSPTTPWKTLAKVDSTTFSPGDQILFKSGGSWTGTLQPKGSGSPGAPIVIDKYGGDDMPVINGNGNTDGVDAVTLVNQAYWEINNLEITNTPTDGSNHSLHGIQIRTTAGTTVYKHIVVKNCYVHHVNLPYTNDGNFPNWQKYGGGINVQGLFDSVLVQNCRIIDVGLEGLVVGGRQGERQYARNVIVDNNLVENVPGDGLIVVNVSGGCKVTNNVVHNACMSNVRNFAGIWTWDSYQTLISHNEVYGMKGGGGNDGMAFDADVSANGDIFEYNYSHDNNGGFLLLMPGVSNIIARYNVSVNDVGTNGLKKLVLMAGGVSNSQIYNNVFYLKNPVNSVFLNNPSGVTISNNIFYVAPAVSVKALVGNESGNPGTPDANAKFLNNCFYPAASFSSLNFGNAVNSNNFYSNPQFTNPVWGAGVQSIDGFKVGITSPCRGAGVFINNNGGKDFWGNLLPAGTPDVGAFQQDVTTQIVDGGVYSFVSAVNNTSVIDATGNSSANGTSLILWSNHNGNNQKWLARHTGDGYYTFKSMLDTTKVMDVRGAATGNGTPLQLYAYSNIPSQKWLISYDGSYFRIKSALIDKYMDVNGASSADGTQIQIWDGNSSNAQKFKLVKQ